MPQSGLQAFRPIWRAIDACQDKMFQSLNRAYKRSDHPRKHRLTRPIMFQSLNRAYKRSDNEATVRRPATCKWFQSLNRAYKRSDKGVIVPIEGTVTMFQSLNRAYKRSDCRHEMRKYPIRSSFNPSIGLTSVPTI